MYFDIFLNEVLEYITTGNKEQMLRNRKHTSSFDKVYTIKVHTIEMPFSETKVCKFNSFPKCNNRTKH